MEPHPQIVERDAELGLIDHLIEALGDGSGSAVALEGPAGIGKTTLVAVAAARAVTEGVEVLRARALDLEQDYPWGVVRQLFDQRLAHASEAEAEELLSGAAAQAAELVLSGPGPVTAAGEDASFAALHGLYWLTANLAAVRPLLIVVDDLHWADAASLRFLVHLLPRVSELPAGLLVALRPHEAQAGGRLVGSLLADPAVQVARPSLLTRDATHELLRDALGEELSPDLGAACHEATGGNPLLVRQCLAAAERTSGPTRADDLVEAGAEEVERGVDVRMARMPASALRLARALAVLGDGGDEALAVTLAGLSTDEVGEAQSHLRGGGILSSGPALEFAHPLVRTAVYRGMDPVLRNELHAGAADALASDPDRAAPHIASRPPRGDPATVAKLREAAAGAVNRGAPDAALRLIERCLAEPPPDDDLLDLHRMAGDVARAVDLAAARRHLEEALRLADDSPTAPSVGRMLAHALSLAGDSRGAARVLGRVLPLADDEEARLRLEAMHLVVTSSEPELQDQWAEALETARCSPEGGSLGHRIRDCATLFFDIVAGRDRPGVLRRLGATLESGLVELAAPELPMAVSYWAAPATDLDGALAFVEMGLGNAHRRGSLAEVVTARLLRSTVLRWRGQLADAEHDAIEASRAISGLGLESVGPFAPMVLAGVRLDRGDLAGASAAIAEAGLDDPLPTWTYLFWPLATRAEVELAAKEPERALASIDEARHRFEAIGGRNPGILPWRSLAARAHHALGDGDRAAELAHDEVELAREWGAPHVLGRSLRIAGAVTGDARGLASLEESVEVLERTPARLEHGRALLELGASLRRDGRRADARGPLQDALRLAEESGAAPDADRAGDELAASGASPRREPAEGVAALTPSERRVADLAAEGARNKEIAQELYVTTKTVELHLTNVYRKLGVSGRGKLSGALAS